MFSICFCSHRSRPYSFGLGKRSVDEEPNDDLPNEVDQGTYDAFDQYDDSAGTAYYPVNGTAARGTVKWETGRHLLPARPTLHRISETESATGCLYSHFIAPRAASNIKYLNNTSPN